ncbi:MAG: hypothetical protein K2X81_05700, partial [Candidatus Obscuribacterales bacterium]|nr:hypothetical protein [Candidatus Obscuribacterales bacterium]
MVDAIENKSDLLDKSAEKKQSQLADFGQSLFHQGVESPVNALSQIVGKVTGTKLPELQIAGPTDNSSVGTILGTMVGGAVDYFVLSKAAGPLLGNLGGNGLAGNALRAGLVGSVYSGVFTPSDVNSDSFLRDRLSQGMVGGVTFAAMSAAAGGLDKTGRFAVPEMRSLSGSLLMGGVSGVAGGVAHAEADALLNKGSLLPTMSDVASDAAGYGIFGATMGGLNWGYNKFTVKLDVSEVHSKVTTNGKDLDAKVRLYRNASGDILKMDSDLPAKDSTYDRIGWTATKMSNGTWAGRGYESIDGKWVDSYGAFVPPTLTDIAQDANGAVRMTTDDGKIRTFEPNGKLSSRNPAEEARMAEYLAKHPPFNPADYTNDKGVRNIQLRPDGKYSSNYMSIEKDGTVNQVILSSGDNGTSATMQR